MGKQNHQYLHLIDKRAKHGSLPEEIPTEKQFIKVLVKAIYLQSNQQLDNE